MAKKFLKKFLPDQGKIEKNKYLRFLGPALFHPNLWHINRRSIAVGLAIGIFSGFIIPLGQIPLAAVISLFLRANLPIAVASTFVTNPFTFAPIYYLAYRLGAFILGNHDPKITPETMAETMQSDAVGTGISGWIEQIGNMGAPLALGLLIMAVVGAALAYAGVRLLWRLNIVIRMRKKQRPK